MRRFAVLATLVIAACTKAQDAPPAPPSVAHDAMPVPAATARSMDAEAGDADAGDAAASQDAALADAEAESEAYRSADPISGKSIGHTSVAFKLKLGGSLEAAFKPKSKRGNSRYRGEVAAFRIARALDLDNVPLALVRTFDAEKLRRALTPSAAELFDQEAIVKDGKITGALIPWIPKLEFVALEAEPWLSRWRGWLKNGGEIPDDQRAMASQISTMIVFDYVTGNWDRWSGGNVGLDHARGSLLFIDNDGAFYDEPPAQAQARQIATLRGVDRFAKHFVMALRGMDKPSVAHVLGDESPGEALLSARARDGFEARRKRALEIIDGKIAAAGMNATLPFD